MAIKLPKSQELNDLIEKVTEELETHFAKAEAETTAAELRKADGDKDGPPEGTPGEDASAGDAPPAAAGGPPEAPEAPPAGGDAPPAAPPGADPTAPAGAPPDAAAGATDVATLEQKYATMGDDELKANYLALKAAIFARMQGGAGGPPGADPAAAGAGVPPGVPPGAGAPPPPMDAAAGGPPPGVPPAGIAPPQVVKSEIKAPAANGGSTKGVVVEKSENEKLEKLEKSLAEVQATNERMASALKTILTTPQRKAVIRIPYQDRTGSGGDEKPLKKSASEMTKKEVQQKVLDLSKTPDLKKSDRERINKYVCGTLKVTDIEDLLQKD